MIAATHHRAQSPLNPETLTISAQRCASLRRIRSVSAREAPETLKLASLILWRVSAVCSAARICSLSMSSTGTGVPVGAITANQLAMFILGWPASVKVGTSGSRVGRCAAVVANARSRPPWTWAAPSAVETNAPAMSPFTSAMMTSPVAR